uniref:Uncharacterized protein n=1 Tax=Heterorhabditis bacteriophora TaxID=37862 RepID=A0A1I7X539_HETBA
MIVEALSFRDWMNLLLKTDLHNVHRSHCHKSKNNKNSLLNNDVAIAPLHEAIICCKIDTDGPVTNDLYQQGVVLTAYINLAYPLFDVATVLVSRVDNVLVVCH